MLQSPALPMRTALEGREGGELNAKGGRSGKQNAWERGESERCFLFTSWLKGAFVTSTNDKN